MPAHLTSHGLRRTVRRYKDCTKKSWGVGSTSDIQVSSISFLVSSVLREKVMINVLEKTSLGIYIRLNISQGHCSMAHSLTSPHRIFCLKIVPKLTHEYYSDFSVHSRTENSYVTNRGHISTTERSTPVFPLSKLTWHPDLTHATVY